MSDNKATHDQNDNAYHPGPFRSLGYMISGCVGIGMAAAPFLGFELPRGENGNGQIGRAIDTIEATFGQAGVSVLLLLVSVPFLVWGIKGALVHQPQEAEPENDAE